MSIQGLMDRALRSFKSSLNKVLGIFDKKVEFREWNKHKRDRPLKRRSKKKLLNKSKIRKTKEQYIPESFQEEIFEEDQSRAFFTKKRAPWLRSLKRIAAGFLLLVNFVFSQFLLSTYVEGQIMFIVFLGNSFIILDYLWKTRRRME